MSLQLDIRMLTRSQLKAEYLLACSQLKNRPDIHVKTPTERSFDSYQWVNAYRVRKQSLNGGGATLATDNEANIPEFESWLTAHVCSNKLKLHCSSVCFVWMYCMLRLVNWRFDACLTVQLDL